MFHLFLQEKKTNEAIYFPNNTEKQLFSLQ